MSSDRSVSWRHLMARSRSRKRSSVPKKAIRTSVRYRPSIKARSLTRMYPGRINEPKVLVMCQRKADTREKTGDSDSENVPLLVSKLEHFVDQIWPGSRPRMEYLSNLKGVPGYVQSSYPTGVVDFDLKLTIDHGKSSPEAQEFMLNHKGYYDMVIMQTCPFYEMNFGLISAVLKDTGYLALQAFSSFDDLYVGTISHLPTLHKNAVRGVNHFFTQVKSPVDSTDEYFFRKKK